MISLCFWILVWFHTFLNSPSSNSVLFCHTYLHLILVLSAQLFGAFGLISSVLFSVDLFVPQFNIVHFLCQLWCCIGVLISLLQQDFDLTIKLSSFLEKRTVCERFCLHAGLKIITIHDTNTENLSVLRTKLNSHITLFWYNSNV